MIRSVTLWVVGAILLFASHSTFAENSRKRTAPRGEGKVSVPGRTSTKSRSTNSASRPAPKQREVTSTIESASRVPDSPEASTSFQAVMGTNPRYLFSSGFGVHVLSKPGVALQGQFMVSVNTRRTYYVGADFTYTLFAPGTSMIIAPAVWYDFRIYGAPRLSCLFGLVAGPVFNSGVAGFSNTSYAFFSDLALVQEVDDLISVKGQFRPGLLGGSFTYVMSFQVAFRFL